MTTQTDLVLIDRIDEQPDATRSLIYLRGEKSRFVALEDVVRTGPKVYGRTAIPAGRYPLVLEESDHFSREYYTRDDKTLLHREEWEKLSPGVRSLYHPHLVITVLKVPDFDKIRQHWGCVAADTKGCTLIGSRFGRINGNSAVLESRLAYLAYYAAVAPAIAGGGQFITFRNSFTLAA